MILWLFITFFAIAILFIFYGAANDDPMTLTIGFAFLMLPSFALSGWDAPLIPDTPGIQYTDGFTENTTYTYDPNATGQSDDILATTTTRIDTYSTYQNHTFGSALLLVAAFGMWFSIAMIQDTQPEGKLPRINWRRYR